MILRLLLMRHSIRHAYAAITPCHCLRCHATALLPTLKTCAASDYAMITRHAPLRRRCRRLDDCRR
jgi:hypothetical protein